MLGIQIKSPHEKGDNVPTSHLKPQSKTFTVRGGYNLLGHWPVETLSISQVTEKVIDLSQQSETTGLLWKTTLTKP